MKYSLLLLFLFSAGSIRAQQAPSPAEGTKTAAKTITKTLKVDPVLTDALTDSALAGYDMQCSTLTLPAGYSDSIAHRHDADLFGYILKGTVRIRLDGKEWVTYRQGQMFHEPRNILHNGLVNVDQTTPAQVLVVYIIKKGRSHYHEEK